MLQANKPDVFVGVPMFACTSLLASRLGVPYVSLSPGGILGNSFMQPLWRGSSRDFHVSPRLSSVAEFGVLASHPMVQTHLPANGPMHSYFLCNCCFCPIPGYCLLQVPRCSDRRQQKSCLQLAQSCTSIDMLLVQIIQGPLSGGMLLGRP